MFNLFIFNSPLFVVLAFFDLLTVRDQFGPFDGVLRAIWPAVMRKVEKLRITEMYLTRIAEAVAIAASHSTQAIRPPLQVYLVCWRVRL
jgi:hypothetical protein